MKIKILVMAAGGSKRMGQPKQLLDFRGQSLVSHCINECLRSDLGKVIVTLGAHADEINKEISELQCKILLNKNWSNGLGSNIAFAVANIDTSNIDGVIIVLADQPFLTAKILTKITGKISQETTVCSSKYKIGSGPPVYFSKKLFTELKDLRGDDGAKGIIKKYINSLEQVEFLAGDIDIDSPQDLNYITP